MGIQYFELDSNATGYAAAIAALAVLDAAKYNFTPTQTIRDAAHDSTFKIIKANVTDAELDEDADLVNLRSANFPNALCVDRFTDLTSRRERLFPALGEMARSAFPNHTAVEYVLPDGDASGLGDGTTPYDGYDGLESTSIGTTAGTYEAGVVYYVLGIHAFVQTGTPNFGSQGDLPVEDALGATSLDIRGDHELMPGMICGGWVDGRAVESWVKDGSSNMYSQTDAIQRTVSTSGWTLKPADATLSKTDLEDYILEHVSTVQECRDNPGTIHIPDTVGTTGSPKIAYVHAPDGSDPTGRAMQHEFGYNFSISVNPQIGNYKFINLTLFEAKAQFASWGTGGVGGTNDAPDTVYFLGCRIILPYDMKSFNKATLHHFGASTDGRVLWDTSDRIDDSDQRIIDLKNHAKASPRNPGDTVVDAKFSDMSRWTHIVRSKNGPYALSGGNTDVLSEMVIDGVIFEDIGATSYKGIDLSDNDMHALGGQRCDTWNLQRFVVFRAGSAVNLYSKASGTMPTSGTAQDINDNTIAWFLIDTNNQVANVAGQNGVLINGDNDSILADNGTGDKSGNVVEFFYIRNMIPDTPGENNAIAVSLNNEQNTIYRDYIIENCNQDFRGQRNYTDANAKNWGSYSTIKNGKHIRGSNSNNVWWERSGSWVSGSGVIDADDIEIVLQDGESSSTDLFELTGTGSATLAEIQAVTKTNGGADANVSSVFWTNTTLT